MTRTFAANDFDAIRRRLAEVDAEKLAPLRCTCTEVEDAQGHRTRSHSFSCAVHGDDPLAAALSAAGYRLDPGAWRRP